MANGSVASCANCGVVTGSGCDCCCAGTKGHQTFSQQFKHWRVLLRNQLFLDGMAQVIEVRFRPAEEALKVYKTTGFTTIELTEVLHVRYH